ncbi:MAG: UPF0158 family protein [Chloroflexi bacterium]|nr:UPF0158 family protein [Chloroflexota bacterium]
MTRKLHIDLDELVFAFDSRMLEAEYYLNTKTGEILLVSEEGRRDLERLSEQAQSLEHLEELIKQKIPAGIQDEVITLARFEAEEDDYILVPTTPSYAGYQDMEEFIQTVSNVALQNMLQEAIQGKGAFRRFKDALLDAPEERERWFKFKEAAMEQRVREWLAENDIEPT